MKADHYYASINDICVVHSDQINFTNWVACIFKL